MNPHNNRRFAILCARSWMSQRALFLDTETTGLEEHAQAVEVAVIDREGLLQFHSLIKPTIPIPAGATQVHGITDKSVANARGFAEIGPKLWGTLVENPIVITYNADFDLRILHQSGRAAGVDVTHWPNVTFACAMLLFAQFNGEPALYGGYKPKSLNAAMRLCQINLPTGLHRAQADAEACRQVVTHIARQEID